MPPWTVRDDDVTPGHLTLAASRFTLANGWVGVRGVPDQPGPDAGPGTLLAAVHDDEDHTYAEGGYGYPATLERIVPVADAWRTAVTIDGAPVDPSTADAHERVLHLDRGVLDATTRWTTPSGAAVVLSSRRLVSLVRRSVVGQRWELTVEDGDGPVEVVVVPAAGCHDGATARDGTVPHDDGRAGARVLTESCAHDVSGSRIHQRTTRSGIGLAAVTRHVLELGGEESGVGRADDANPTAEASTTGDVGDRATEAGTGDASVRTTEGGTGEVSTGAAEAGTDEVRLSVEPGQRVAFTVLAAYAVGVGPGETLEDEASTVLAEAERAGWSELVAEQERYLAGRWARGDVVVEGDELMQRAVRFAIFHVLQSAAQVAGVGVRAKGLTGTEYHGHTFWDSECFILPVLDHVLPEAAAAHLRWRHSTLPQARDRAAELGLAGAAFPWRTITGRESSGYWPAGSAAYHVNADITHAVARHVDVTGDEAFAREVGVELAVETARLWARRGHHTDTGFHLHGVTGPDEYTAVVDDNAYTNVMARRNLRTALDLTSRFPEVAAGLGVDEDEQREWARAADRMVVPRSERLGVTEQHAGFTELAPWPFRPAGTDQYPLQEHAPFWEIYRHQVVKQADVVMALHLAGDDLDVEQKRRDLEYYEPMTVRDSSLSAPAQAVVAAEVGHGELAWAYARETALIDLLDLDGSTEQGLHIAALAGAWTALVAGFGGLRHGGTRMRFAPRLPGALTGLSFEVSRGAARVRVAVRRDAARYELLHGETLALSHHGEPFDLTAREPVAEHPVPPWPDLVPPSQPPDRAPRA